MEYKKQINRVIDYITSNLDKKMSVGELSDVAGLSPSHFHRIFKAEVGETLSKFTMRKRMEKAGRMLIRNHDSQVANIAIELGFSSVSVFCRNFKQHFTMTTEEYRGVNCKQNSRNSQFESAKDESQSVYRSYLCRSKTIKIEDKTMKCTFEIKELAPKQVIYCRHTGSFDEMGEAFTKVLKWAYPRGLVHGAPQLAAVYLDDPTVTEPEKLQSDACVIIEQEVKVDGQIGKYTISGGKYAVGRFEILMSEFGVAWQSMCALVVENGCQAIDGHHHEIYLNNCDEHPQNKFIVDICIPVKPI